MVLHSLCLLSTKFMQARSLRHARVDQDSGQHVTIAMHVINQELNKQLQWVTKLRSMS